MQVRGLMLLRQGVRAEHIRAAGVAARAVVTEEAGNRRRWAGHRDPRAAGRETVAGAAM